MIHVVGVYSFTVLGDGESTEVSLPLRGMKTPAPAVEGMLPVGVVSSRTTSKGNKVTAEIEGDRMLLEFKKVMAEGATAQVQVQVYFGMAQDA